MPNFTVYIRKEDVGKWLALKQKSERIHQLLNEETLVLTPVIPTTDTSFHNQPLVVENPVDSVETFEKQTEEIMEDKGGGQNAAPLSEPDEEELFIPAEDTTPPPIVNSLPENIRGMFINANSLASKKEKKTEPGEALECCKREEPCDHWIWDGLVQAWRNSISGEVRSQG